MGRLLWLAAALVAVGCGKVNNTNADATPADVLPDSFSCQTPELACGGACTNAMTDIMNCGTCGNSCEADREMCTAGHCVDNFASCVTLKKANMLSAIYTLTDMSIVYCDMEDGGVAYSDLAMDNFNAAANPPYTMVLLADLQAAPTQAAFVALYNQQGGNIHVLNQPMDGIGDCAIKVSTTVNMELGLSASLVIPSTTGGAGPTLCEAAYTGVANISFAKLTGPVYAPVVMPATYFTANPATEIAGSDGANPAFFWRKVSP